MQIEQVSDAVHVVTGTNVNWALVSDDSGVTLIDAGYPADAADVRASIREIGHELADLAAVLVTHAHLDHIGGIPPLVEQLGVPVYTGSDEVPHLKREYLQQITPLEVAAQLFVPGGLTWVLQTARAIDPLKGGLGTKVPSATAAEPEVLAELPGGLVAIATPGHTTGHTAYLMPAEGVIFTGDALVTGHRIARREGPQLIPSVFQHDEAQALVSARALAGYDAGVLVPGHGKPMRERISVLVAEL
ncbi:MBL fold metallo-hydrolase [Nocardia inohanensis]|uniref:MBL fold metallo-hydrolase n=1 Tax=Nocardia inohanensis TaxID=209246 RepID=UPI00082AF0AB|nr:MBL fold metallo-hydrolase [Nocardia inohanensis]